MNISGRGAIPTGRYEGNIAVSGRGVAEGDVDCLDISTSGSSSVSGSLKAENIRVSGTSHIAGEVSASSLSVSGSFRADKDVNVAKGVKISGTLSCTGRLRASEISVSGGASVGSLEAESLKISGSVDTKGLINAETVDIRIGGKQCTAGSIGGGTIKISAYDIQKKLHRMPLLSSILDTASGFEVAEAVEGDMIAIEMVHAPRVTGRTVAIGAGCRIDLVQYSEKIEIDPEARVMRTEKI